jgi:hypothetical protein
MIIILLKLSKEAEKVRINFYIVANYWGISALKQVLKQSKIGLASYISPSEFIWK